MNRIRIGFCRPTGPLGRLIAWIQAWARGRGARDVPSHVIILADVAGRTLVLGADANGFVAQSLERFRRRGKILAIPELKASLDAAAGRLIDMLDQPYGYAELVGMLSVEVARRLGRRAQNPFASSRTLFCSEAAALLLRAAHYPGAEKLRPGSVDPLALYDFMREGPC